ncbi:hypothetical protein BDW22DRAFT_823612 [Trametopsis cervina]|nr:hypothetical protein BDW22DRAFT_823612 [Trametopsis cervina]
MVASVPFSLPLARQSIHVRLPVHTAPPTPFTASSYCVIVRLTSLPFFSFVSIFFLCSIPTAFLLHTPSPCLFPGLAVLVVARFPFVSLLVVHFLPSCSRSHPPPLHVSCIHPPLRPSPPRGSSVPSRPLFASVDWLRYRRVCT